MIHKKFTSHVFKSLNDKNEKAENDTSQRQKLNFISNSYGFCVKKLR